MGPVTSDFGYHVILVTDIKPEKVRSLAEATPEIEANLKKAKAQAGFRRGSGAASNNIVYEQSSSLQPAAEKLSLPIQQSPWITQGQRDHAARQSRSCRRRSSPTTSIKGKRNTSRYRGRPEHARRGARDRAQSRGAAPARCR